MNGTREFGEEMGRMDYVCVGSAVIAPVSYTHLTLPTICSV